MIIALWWVAAYALLTGFLLAWNHAAHRPLGVQCERRGQPTIADADFHQLARYVNHEAFFNQLERQFVLFPETEERERAVLQIAALRAENYRALVGESVTR